MKSLYIEGNELNPKIILSKDENQFEISGSSLADEPEENFRPALNWLLTYRENANPKTILEFKMNYINTASTKHILDLISSLEKMPNSSVVWFYNDNNIDMKEIGEEFAEIVNIPFDFRPY